MWKNEDRFEVDVLNQIHHMKKINQNQVEAPGSEKKAAEEITKPHVPQIGTKCYYTCQLAARWTNGKIRETD